MDWIFVALASAFVFGVVSIFDKVILMRYVPSPRTFIVMVGMIQFPMGLVVLPFFPLQGYPAMVVATAYFSGFVWGISLVAMFWAMSREDVSRVIPVISISPVFVAILAVIFLNERLTAFHWVAILVTVGGAALISMRMTGKTRHISLSPSFFLLLFGSMAFAGGQFLSKLALEEDMSVWNLFALRNFGLGTACILLMMRPSTLPDICRVLVNPTSASVFVMTEGVLVFAALLFTLWAIALGPVSLVATVQSTRPLFVFGMSVMLSLPLWHLLNEPLDKRTLANKLVSTAMIVAGISAISLL